MSEDKKKAKDAILGELESIKHLLEENQQDDLDEPPILTNHLNDVADDDTDVPMLTEALNEVLDDIRMDNSSEDAFDDLDIPVLTPIGKHSNAGHEPDEDINIPVLEPLTDDSLIHDDAQFLDTEFDDDDIPTLNTSSATDDAPDDGPDDLVARALKNRASAATATEDITSPKETDVPTAMAVLETPQDDPSETEAPLAPSGEQDIFDLEALADDDLADLPENTPKTTDAASQTVLEAAKPEASKSTSKQEHQPSLFDSPKSPPNSKPSQAVAQAPAKPQTQAAERTVKTDNPFLPKHIRDRLHTNRTLQQEIESNRSSVAATPSSNTTPTAPSSTPASAAPSSNTTPSAPSTPGASTSADGSAQAHADEKLVDEVIKSLLPKFEQELRAKVRELIAEERDNTPEQ